MKRFYTTVFFAALLTALLVAACGDGNNDDPAATNNAETNNANNTANNETNNTANNTANNTNNTDPNNDPNNTTNDRTEPFITQFTYYEETENALGSTREGFTVGVSNTVISNTDGNEKPLSEADLLAFEEAHLGADTIDAMRNGWGCPEPMNNPDVGTGADAGTDAGTSEGGSTFWFEARIQEDGNNREIQEITGCVETDDAATGAIIDAINELGEQYL